MAEFEDIVNKDYQFSQSGAEDRYCLRVQNLISALIDPNTSFSPQQWKLIEQKLADLKSMESLEYRSTHRLGVDAQISASGLAEHHKHKST